MPKIVAVEHLTLDGIMQAPGRPEEDRRNGFEFGGWASASTDPKLQQAIGARMGVSWSLLFGRTTFEDFANVWPNRPKPNPFTDVLNRTQKFVASRTLTEPLVWENSTLLKGDVPTAVAELKRDHDKTLVIFGSGTPRPIPHGQRSR